MTFKKRVLNIVKRIPKGRYLSYKKVAELTSSFKSWRAVGNILAKNRDPKIPCHRVIKNSYLIGGYLGSEKNSWKKAGLLLKEGTIGVIPTDTIYGICASALNKNGVKKVYQLRKRNKKKPFIILINSFKDLEEFYVSLKEWQKKFLKKIWPGKFSVIFNCFSKKFFYLHKGTKALAFRLPKHKELLKILSISGPLIAPSANWENFPPAKNIKQAKRYFGNKIFYYNKGNLVGKPSTLIDLTSKKIKILRHNNCQIKKIFKQLHLNKHLPASRKNESLRQAEFKVY